MGGVSMLTNRGHDRAEEHERRLRPPGPRITTVRPNLSLSISVSRTIEGTLLLSATAGDVSLRQVVHQDGSFHAQVDHSRDRLALAAFEGRLSLTYGSRSVVLAREECSDPDWRGARELMLAAPVARMFRRLLAELEAARSLDADLVALRASGALLGEVDGDEGAVRRLARELIVRQAAEAQAPSGSQRFSFDPLTSLLAATLRASADLEARVMKVGVWGADRIGPQLEWALRVNAAWFAVSGPLARRPSVPPAAPKPGGGSSC